MHLNKIGMQKKYLKQVFVVLGSVCLLGIYQIAKTQIRKHQKIEMLQNEEEEKPLTLAEIATGEKTGEDPFKEIEKIIHNYGQKNNLSYTGTIKLYENEEDEKSTEEKTTQFKKDGNRVYYSIGPIEYIYEKAQLLMIDHESKIMQITPLEENAQNQQTLQLQQMKKYMEADSAQAIVTKTEKEKIITILNPLDPAVQQYSIHYNPDTYYVTEVQMVMVRTEEMTGDDYEEAEELLKQREKEKEKNPADTTMVMEELGIKQTVYRVAVFYRDFTTTVTWIPEQTIDEYILRQGSEIEPRDAYKEYELND
jgi:hypothetical protein